MHNRYGNNSETDSEPDYFQMDPNDEIRQTVQKKGLLSPTDQNQGRYRNYNSPSHPDVLKTKKLEMLVKKDQAIERKESLGSPGSELGSQIVYEKGIFYKREKKTVKMDLLTPGNISNSQIFFLNRVLL